MSYVTCTCPATWNGILPPYCGVHNPAAFPAPKVTFSEPLKITCPWADHDFAPLGDGQTIFCRKCGERR